MPQYDTFFSLSSPAVSWNPRCAASAVSLCLRTLPHAFFSSRFFSLWLDANTSVSRLLLSTYMLSLEKGRGGTQGRRNEGPALTPKLPSGGEIRKKCNRRKTIKTYTQNGCMVLWKSMGFEIKQPLIYHFWMVGMFANVYILSSLEDIVSLLLEKEERIEEVGGGEKHPCEGETLAAFSYAPRLGIKPATWLHAWPGIEPVAFQSTGQCYNQVNHTGL